MPAKRKAPKTENKSWVKGNKGQGGEGLSKGYGGSKGSGTGPSGAEPDEVPSSLPSRERIKQVLR